LSVAITAAALYTHPMPFMLYKWLKLVMMSSRTHHNAVTSRIPSRQQSSLVCHVSTEGATAVPRHCTSNQDKSKPKSYPSFSSSSFCALLLTTSMMLMPRCFARDVIMRPRVEPAAVWIMYSPSGGLLVSTRPFAVIGLTCQAQKTYEQLLQRVLWTCRAHWLRSHAARLASHPQW